MGRVACGFVRYRKALPIDYYVSLHTTTRPPVLTFKLPRPLPRGGPTSHPTAPKKACRMRVVRVGQFARWSEQTPVS